MAIRTQDELRNEIEDLWNDHAIMRSVFQDMRPRPGEKCSWYKGLKEYPPDKAGDETPYKTIVMKVEIDGPFIDENNERAHRLNHAFVVGLWAILEDLDQEAGKPFLNLASPGKGPWSWLDMCRRMRHVAGHGQRGRYFAPGSLPSQSCGRCDGPVEHLWVKNSRFLKEHMEGRQMDPLEANGERFNFSKPAVLLPLKDGCLDCVDRWFK